MKSAITAVIVLVSCIGASAQGTYTGNLDSVGCDNIVGSGWYSGSPNSPWPVDIFADSTYLTTVQADVYRADLFAAGIGNGYHGFSYPMPASLKDGHIHAITAVLSWTGVGIGSHNSPVCSASSTGYQYYYTDPLTSINTNNWYSNGSLTAGTSGITTPNTSSTGSLISKVAVPGGSHDYEVSMTLSLTASTGYYVAFMRGSSNAMAAGTPTGTYYATQLAQPTFSGGSCSATLQLFKVSSGGMAILSSIRSVLLRLTLNL